MIDFLLLVLYSTAAACGIYIIYRHRQYFYERFKKGVVSVFMLAMLFFLMAYTFNMLIILLFRLVALLGADSAARLIWLNYSWAIAQFGTTVGIIILALMTRSGKYDQFIYLKKIERKEDHHADTNAGKK
ncbi:hypothetical protein [Paenibacillus sp. FSL R5-0470]|uniref:hypothetical protein n=1 Tax=Paenibacillus sp. FSL R5-0470 TaxID=2921641 RepID=UPI0030D91464